MHEHVSHTWGSDICGWLRVAAKPRGCTAANAKSGGFWGTFARARSRHWRAGASRPGHFRTRYETLWGRSGSGWKVPRSACSPVRDLGQKAVTREAGPWAGRWIRDLAVVRVSGAGVVMGTTGEPLGAMLAGCKTLGSFGPETWVFYLKVEHPCYSAKQVVWAGCGAARFWAESARFFALGCENRWCRPRSQLKLS